MGGMDTVLSSDCRYQPLSIFSSRSAGVSAVQPTEWAALVFSVNAATEYTKHLKTRKSFAIDCTKIFYKKSEADCRKLQKK